MCADCKSSGGVSLEVLSDEQVFIMVSWFERNRAALFGRGLDTLCSGHGFFFWDVLKSLKGSVVSQFIVDGGRILSVALM